MKALSFKSLESFSALAMKRGPLAGTVNESVTTDGQPASLSWKKAPIWGLRPDLYYRYIFTFLVYTIFIALRPRHYILASTIFQFLIHF
jgi:hypothetical protein